jgi:bifunctional enzyme CysN/CysC
MAAAASAKKTAPAAPAAALPTSTATPIATPVSRAPVLADLAGSLRVLTCGSVDDGKSTLIGRLLWDASDLFDDQRATVTRSGRLAGDGENPDFSLLVDGLAAEREQGITIDIAWRYFEWGNRRLVIVDSPGHEQYTRNMATGASHADVALLLVDARAGIKRQTRRHAAILDLAGVKRVILAVNKMDLVGWSQESYRAIADDFALLARRFGFTDAVAIPVAAPSGDNVTRTSARMPWYDGPTLLDQLMSLPPREGRTAGAFRLPVQLILRDGRDFRGLAGTISSGTVKVGDAVRDSVTGERARVSRIVTMDRDLKQAVAGQAVTITLDRDIDIARGAVLSDAGNPPRAAKELVVRLVWMAESPFDTRAGYLVRTATDLAPLSEIDILKRLDLETLAAAVCDTAQVNDIVDVRLVPGRAVAVDRFSEAPGTGAVLIVDSVSGATVAGGVVLSASEAASLDDETVFRLTRERLAAGVCKDLGDSERDTEEFRRRAGEVAILLRSAGVPVRLDL